MGAILDFITHKKIASGAVLVFLVAVFWFSVTLQDIFYTVVFFAEAYVEQHQTLGVFVFMAFAGVSAMLSPFSSVPLIPVAIMLWGNAWTIAFLIAGWLGGHVLTYTIGYFAGNPIAKKFVSFEMIEQYLRAFSKRSEFLLVLLFRLASPAEVPGYVLGAVRYNFVKYFLATCIAEVPFAIITVYAGEAFIDRKPFVLAAAIIAGLVFFAVAFYFFKKQIRQKEH